jgi:hypothetical protein
VGWSESERRIPARAILHGVLMHLPAPKKRPLWKPACRSETGFRLPELGLMPPSITLPARKTSSSNSQCRNRLSLTGKRLLARYRSGTATDTGNRTSPLMALPTPFQYGYYNCRITSMGGRQGLNDKPQEQFTESGRATNFVVQSSRFSVMVDLNHVRFRTDLRSFVLAANSGIRSCGRVDSANFPSRSRWEHAFG